MYVYSLNRTASNQSFTTVIDGFTFDITLNTAFGMLFATVDVDGERVKTSCRCVNGAWIIPYSAYVPEGCGNFLFATKDENYPGHQNFNDTCVLVYYSEKEIKELSNG